MVAWLRWLLGLLGVTLVLAGLFVAAFPQWATGPGVFLVLLALWDKVLGWAERLYKLAGKDREPGTAPGPQTHGPRSPLHTGTGDIVQVERGIGSIRIEQSQVWIQSPVSSAQGEGKAEVGRSAWLLAHPYPLPADFTGREREQALLDAWLADEAHPVFVLRALGGFGKSALVWHWLHRRVSPEAWPRVVWWSFYDTGASFEEFLSETLMYLLGEADPQRLPPREQVQRLLAYLQTTPALLVLDGFERALRAYGSLAAAYQGDDLAPEDEARGRECVDPRAAEFLGSVAASPGRMRGKVLLTTRLRPRVLEDRIGTLLAGVREVELTGLAPADAVAFLQRLGVRGRRDELRAAAEAYGYHPLSLRLLAGYVLHHRRAPGDIRAAADLDLTGDLVARKHHILEAAYESLNPAARKTLGALACFRGVVTYEDMKAALLPKQPNWFDRLRCVFIKKCLSEAQLKSALDVLEARGLVHWDRAVNRYDLHPIVRRYAYDRLTQSERTATHARLADYFAAVETPERIQSLRDLEPLFEFYHHLVRAGRLDAACRLYHDRLSSPLYYRLAAYEMMAQLLRVLFPYGLEQPPALETASARAWTVNELGRVYARLGQLRRAISLYNLYIEIAKKYNFRKNLNTGLGNLAVALFQIGKLKQSESKLQSRLKLSQEMEYREYIVHREMGRLSVYKGQWRIAKQELCLSLRLLRQMRRRGRAYWRNRIVIRFYHGLLCLLIAREDLQQRRVCLMKGLRIARSTLGILTKMQPAWPREEVRIYWLMGSVCSELGEWDEAEKYLLKAMNLCREINLVEMEADILLSLARLRADQGRPAEALRLAEEALTIAQRSEYRLQLADIHLFLARLARQGHLLPEDREAGLTPAAAARQHAQAALDAAACDGPPYHYKVAYEEAQAMLEGMR